MKLYVDNQTKGDISREDLPLIVRDGLDGGLVLIYVDENSNICGLWLTDESGSFIFKRESGVNLGYMGWERLPKGTKVVFEV